jgi:hypothetical protein
LGSPWPASAPETPRNRRFGVPAAGELAYAFDAMEIPADPALLLTACSVEPGSPVREKLRLLRSWWATVHDSAGICRGHLIRTSHITAS